MKELLIIDKLGAGQQRRTEPVPRYLLLRRRIQKS